MWNNALVQKDVGTRPETQLTVEDMEASISRVQTTNCIIMHLLYVPLKPKVAASPANSWRCSSMLHCHDLRVDPKDPAMFFTIVMHRRQLSQRWRLRHEQQKPVMPPRLCGETQHISALNEHSLVKKLRQTPIVDNYEGTTETSSKLAECIIWLFRWALDQLGQLCSGSCLKWW